MNETATIEETLQAYGLTYSAVFLPVSTTDRPDQINWSVTVTGKSGFITCHYSQGIGHLPGYTFGRSVTDREAINRALETRVWHMKMLPPPSLADVMYSLLMDGNAVDYASFDDWCADLGYDTDSRKAESTYRECLDIGLKLRTMIGDAGLAELREVFQDY